MQKLNKKAAVQYGALLFILVLVFVGYMGFKEGGWFRGLGAGELAVTAGGPSAAVTTPAGITYCGVEDVAVILSSNRLGKQGTSYTNTHHLFIQTRDGNWISKGLKAEASSNTVGINTPVRVLFGGNGTEDVDTAAVYPVYFEGNTNCIDPYEIKAEMAKADISPTIFAKNDDGTLTASTDLSLDAGEHTSIELNLKTTADEYVGNPECSNGNLLVCESNSTFMDKLSIQGAKKVTTPTFWTMHDTSRKTWTYEIPKLTSKPTVVMLDIEVSDNHEPTTTGNDFNCTVVDVSHYVDADTYEIVKCVYEDEDGNDIGLTPTAYTGTESVQILVS